jgi:hypothetical protein
VPLGGGGCGTGVGVGVGVGAETRTERTVLSAVPPQRPKRFSWMVSVPAADAEYVVEKVPLPDPVEGNSGLPRYELRVHEAVLFAVMTTSADEPCWRVSGAAIVPLGSARSAIEAPAA